MSDGTFGQPGVVQLLIAVTTFTIWAYDGPTQLAVSCRAVLVCRRRVTTPGRCRVLTYVGSGSNSLVLPMTQETESWAVFFQGTFNITDNLSITAGVRYTEESKEAFCGILGQ